MPIQRLEAGEPARIVVYGTSLSAEWSARFWRRCGGHWVRALRKQLVADFGARAVVHNASRWGADSDWARASLTRRVLGARPDAVIVEFAINDADVRRAISLQRSRENLETMLDQIAQAAPGTYVLPLVAGHVQGRHAHLRPGLSAYWEVWREVAQTRELGLIDLAPVWAVDSATGSTSSEAFLPDGLHPGKRAGREHILPRVLCALSSPYIR